MKVSIPIIPLWARRLKRSTFILFLVQKEDTKNSINIDLNLQFTLFM